MVDVVRDETPVGLVTLGVDQLAVEFEQDTHPVTGDMLLRIAVRGDAFLDGEAQTAIIEAIAVHAKLAEQRAIQPSHVVHVEPEYETIRNKTFDQARGDKAKPDGEDIVPAHKELRGVELIDVDEQRIPYWGFDETVQTNRPIECPDCRRDLLGANHHVGVYLRCAQAVLKEDVQPCHSGCVVACGLPN